ATLRWREAHILSAGMLVFSFAVILAMSLLARRSGRRIW
ncbi:MAG: molybdate ABC transporter permease subunit, partial [Gammaproteobacteria bacterium]|nr:molybdate ABC transporter permease subunit [Gammaproteobacteria bacterium]